MGRLLLVWRLVLSDVRRRPVEAVLLLLMITTTTTTLTLGLALRKVTESPFARTRAATRGPDVVAQIALSPERSRNRPPGSPRCCARARSRAHPVRIHSRSRT